MKSKNLVILGLALLLLLSSVSAVMADRNYGRCDGCYGFGMHSSQHYKMRETVYINSYPTMHHAFMGFRDMRAMPPMNIRDMPQSCGMPNMHMGY